MSLRRATTHLRLEALEGRETPATFGEAWLDGQHVTLSFAPEGTPILGVGSSLGALLGPLGISTARHDILKAFQTWASQSNLNIGIVADTGAAYDATGALQHDPRYGDIRIAARALAADILALASPSGPWSSSNAGDILLNSDKPFSLDGGDDTYDLYSVFLQESGHAFGVGNSTDPGSAMYETYGGVRTGLTSGDVAAVQALYGARKGDAFEGKDGNNTLGTATKLTGPVEADITTTSDADWYSFTTPAGVGTWVRLKAAGVSLLAPKVEIYNAAGALLASGQSADPQDNDVSVQVGGLGLGGTYYVKVSSARSDVFGIGAYKLGVDSLGGVPTTDPYSLVDTEAVANGLNSPVTLAPVPQLVSRPGDYLVRSSLASPWDADAFKVRSPDTKDIKYNLVVSVGGVGAVNLKPKVEVYTANGTRLSATVVATSGNHVVVAVANLGWKTDYFIKVTSESGAVGNYDLGAVFRTVLPSFHGASGAFDQFGQATTATMNVYQSQVFHLTLGAFGLASSDTNVTVTIYNSQNQVAFRLAVRNGQLDSGTVFLKRGAYKVEVKVAGTGSVPWLGFSLQLLGLTDAETTPPPETDPSAPPDGDPLPPPPTDGGTVTLVPPPQNPPEPPPAPPPATFSWL